MIHLPLLAAGLISTLNPSAAVAKQDDRPAPDPAVLVAALGSPDWSQRESADAELRTLEPPGLGPLLPFLSQPDLGPEQRFRLMQIAADRFTREPHAAMGIQWTTPGRSLEDFDAMPARISATVDGFDAATKLRPGDLILAMDGRPLADRQEMRAAIISHSPGDITTLVVARGALQLEVRLMLGSFAALQQSDRIDRTTLDAALALRLEREDIAEPGFKARAIDGMNLAQWMQAATGPFVRGHGSALDEGELGGLLVGGEARGISPEFTDDSAAARPTIRIVPTLPRAVPTPSGVRPSAPEPRPVPQPAPRPGE